MPTDATVPKTSRRRQKWWRPHTPKSAWLWALSVVSTTALVLSNVDGIMKFARAYTPWGLRAQFPFTMQISSTPGQSPGEAFYRVEHTQDGTLIRRDEKAAKFDLPSLDFRIVNNSSEATFVRELVLKVAKSTPDKRPVLVWPRKVNLREFPNLTLENEGWGVALDTKLENVKGIYAPGKKEKQTAEAFELPLGNIRNESPEIPFSSLFKEHFRVENFAETDRAKFSGTLKYSYSGPAGEKITEAKRFAVTVVNTEWEPEPPAEGPLADFQSVQVLDVDRENYAMPIPTSVNLEPRKAYRFVITLSSRQSAVHEFDVLAKLSNGAQIALGHYRLEYYLPRTMAPEIARLNSNPAPIQFNSLDDSADTAPGGDDLDAPDEPGDVSDIAASATTNPSKPAEGPDDPDPPVKPEREELTAVSPEKISKAPKATYPYGVAVPGHPEIVESPFLSGHFVNVSGFDHNALVQDPYVHQLFLVP